MKWSYIFTILGAVCQVLHNATKKNLPNFQFFFSPISHVTISFSSTTTTTIVYILRGWSGKTTLYLCDADCNRTTFSFIIFSMLTSRNRPTFSFTHFATNIIRLKKSQNGSKKKLAPEKSWNRPPSATPSLSATSWQMSSLSITLILKASPSSSTRNSCLLRRPKDIFNMYHM